ncbi:MAG: DUF3524 domain-containing protein [Candidatus Tritonobacter lacicola]|nr:DUF3524 domain-containing protein [Candidatus Tritonobacter lacicola]
MRVLALEPYYGGSHRSFLDGWIGRSRHSWTLLTLPPYKWKWRMRHSAVTLAARAAEALAGGGGWDLLFCSDMLNLAEFLGLAPGPVRVLPGVVYFHENQLTYPVEHPSEFDYHFAFSNMTTALAAREVWFNSAFHRDSFLEELLSFLHRMPDHRPLEEVERIRAKSRVRYPGIERFPERGKRRGGPLRILWAARWEYDKAPETFFRALEILESEGVDFRLSVVGGGNGRNTLPVFERSKERFNGRIDHWGFRETRDEYAEVLAGADVVVSAADHEFFGISVVEAVAAGAYPLVPKRLAYPEVLGGEEEGKKGPFFYDGGEKELAVRLAELSKRTEKGDLWEGDSLRGVRAVERFYWDTLAPEYDETLSRLS